MNGVEETPPNASPNTGFGTFVFDPTTNQVAYNVTWTGATGTMAHVHTGIPLVAGAILFGLAGPANGPYAGISPALTSVAVADMFNLRHYTNIHSVPFPGGEIRSQNRQNPSLFGYPGVTSAGPLGRVLRIGASGSPVLGGTWIATVHDAMPGAFVSLAYAQDLVAMPLDLTVFGFPNEVLWVNALTGYPTSADPNGCASISFAVPPFPFLVGNAFYFQWVSIEGDRSS